MAGEAEGFLLHVGDAAVHGGDEGAEAVGVEGFKDEVVALDVELMSR